MKNPEQFVQNVQKQYDHQSVQKREQRQEQRQQLAKKAQEALKSVRKLFEEKPEQKSSETDLGQRDLGTERLTPEKIDPEVWNNVRKMLTEKRRNLDDNSGTTVVLVHGIAGWESNGSINGVDCNGGYWGDAITFLKNGGADGVGYSNIRTVKFYNGDTNCDVDLHSSAYKDRCNSFSPGSAGTNNEDLNHVSCLLAQYLNQNFEGKNVILVGHSMGGIIVRNTMYLVETQGGQQGMPSDIGYVTDAVTFNSPHGGVPSDGGFVDFVACDSCKQVEELTSGSDFMNSLGLYPQVPGGTTSWTIVGSECDQYVSAVSAIGMNANQAVVYSTMGKSDDTYDNTCYDHGGALHDSNVVNNAIQYTCSTDDTANSPCGTAYASTDGSWTVGQGPHGLQELYNAASS